MSRLPASRCFSREHPPFLTRVQNFHRPLSSCSPLLFVFPVGSLASWLTRRWNLKLFHSSTRNRWILRGSLRLFLKRPPSSSVLLSLLLPFLSFLFFFLSFCRREQRFAGSSFRLAINAGMEQDVRTLSERYRPPKQFRPLKIIKIPDSLLSYVLSLCKSTVYREVSLPCRIFQG